LAEIYIKYPYFINFQMPLKEIKDNLKIIKEEAEHILSPSYTIENNNENSIIENEK